MRQVQTSTALFHPCVCSPGPTRTRRRRWSASRTRCWSSCSSCGARQVCALASDECVRTSCRCGRRNSSVHHWHMPRAACFVSSAVSCSCGMTFDAHLPAHLPPLRLCHGGAAAGCAAAGVHSGRRGPGGCWGCCASAPYALLLVGGAALSWGRAPREGLLPAAPAGP